MNKWALSLYYITVKTRVSLWHIWCHIRTDLRSFTEILCEYDTFGCCSDTLVLQYSLQASIAELASTAATDVGMHGLLASQSCYHSVLPPSLCTLWTSSRFLHY